MQIQIESFFHQATSTFSHVVADPDSGQAAIIDPVLDFDYKSGRTSTESADQLITWLGENGCQAEWILETHSHADHLTAAMYLRGKLGAKIGIGEGITEVQKTFAKVFNFADDFPVDGSQFDHLFQDNEEIRIGSISGRVMHTPGHTSDSVTYLFGDAAFVGDTMFMPDFGTGRCDFPGGDARLLYQSIQKIYQLPDETRVFLCHDYPPASREKTCMTTIVDGKQHNIHINASSNIDEFIRMRKARDAQLAMPALILPSIQVNIRAGALPERENNGTRYLKLPLDRL
ncbi:MAG: MBL fold metallo-hydrolase [Gammaproteobacteria bacterium]|nr:MBL fold metallo-hydrolase [Gammaproteobacteria bacterium]